MLAAWILGVTAMSGAAAATLAPAAERKVRAATFEVVLPKPIRDSLTYERPLPMDLVPYSIRNDAYEPIGSAFALGKGRFVTAAHVLDAAIGSGRDKALIRGQDGAVHEIGQVLQLSLAEDFAVFATSDALDVAGLPTSTRPVIGAPVYAVGNALGEGIVIRDGLLTSQTPEDRDGAWHWLRFSAAASPGNSGGPLLDDAGRVIGVVLGKSPSENLNYGLPMDRVLEPAEVSVAKLALRGSFAVAISPRPIVTTLDETIRLPLDYAAYAKAYHDVMKAYQATSFRRFREQHGDSLFPAGPGSERMLTHANWGTTLQLVAQEANGQWIAQKAVNTATLALPPDGELRTGTSAGVAVLRLVKPSAMPLETLFTDSKAFMDLVLSAYQLSRPVADQFVRITSLGNASQEQWHVDRYGRRWLLRTWPMEYSATVLVTLSLPKPDGADVLSSLQPAGLGYLAVEPLEFLADYAYTGYLGSLEDWKAFMAMPHLLPRLFHEATIEIDIGKRVRVASKRFELDLDNWVQDIGARSRLDVQPAYFRDGDEVVWDIATVLLAEDRAEETYISLSRRPRPAPSAGPKEQQQWEDIVAGRGDYSGIPRLDPPAVVIARSVLPRSARDLPKGQKPSLVYVARWRVGQVGSPKEIMENLERVVNSLVVLE